MIGYLSYYRILDHHGVLHLTMGYMPFGSALCGHPPVGTELSDPAGSMYPPGQHNRAYKRICDTCNERAAA